MYRIAEERDGNMSSVACRELQTGMTVAEDVKDIHGRLLIPAGIDLTDKHLRALKLWGIPAVQIQSTDETLAPVDLGALPPKVMEQLKAEVMDIFHHNMSLSKLPVFETLFTQCVLRLARNFDPNRTSEEQDVFPQNLNKPEKDKTSPGVTATQTGISPEKLIEKTKDIASLPAIYNEIVEVVYHPRSSSNDVANVISSDTGLTARLLRIVNSAFYGFAARIETVSRAIVVVGTNELCELALATSVMKMFDEALRDVIDMRMFWRHSLCCGAVARILARHRREANLERYFVMGLLHDIGRLVIFVQIPELGRATMNKAAESYKPLSVAEKEMLGFTHAHVGWLLLKTWNLPETHSEAVRFHHQPGRTKNYPMETAIVHMADVITNVIRVGRSGDIAVPPMVTEAWDRLDINTDALPAILSEAEEQVNDLARVFEVDAES